MKRLDDFIDLELFLSAKLYGRIDYKEGGSDTSSECECVTTDNDCKRVECTDTCDGDGKECEVVKCHPIHNVYSVRHVLLLLLLNLVVMCMSGCGTKTASPLDYCTMLKKDQDNINLDKSDPNYEDDRTNRINDIKKNFEELISYSRINGFPYVEINMAGSDSCKFWAITMTMIHAAQTQSEYFFSPKMAVYFQKEIDNGHLNYELIEQCIEAAQISKICRTQRKSIHNAMTIWGMDTTTLNEFNFIECPKEY